MKKLKKKLSYMTKVLLVLSLLFNNLSSLSIVFADELDPDPETEVVATDETVAVSTFEASIDEDNKITLSYTGELNETDELQIFVIEKYAYTNCTESETTPCEESTNTEYGVDEANRTLLTTEGMVVTHTSTVLDNAKLDGNYTLSVSLNNVTKDNETLGEKELINKDVTGEEGISFKLSDPDGNTIEAKNGKYEVNSSFDTVKITGNMLPGGIGPYDEFTFTDDEATYKGKEVLDKTFSNLIGLSNHLYGEFKVPTEVTYTKNGEEETYQEHFSIAYGKYEDNAKTLNNEVNVNEVFFEIKDNKGSMYIYLGKENATIADIYGVLSQVYDDREITYIISNSEYSYEDGGIVAGYDETSGETLDEYLNNISIDSSTKITITDGTITVTYETVILGDLTDDNILDEKDILELIDEIVGNKELNSETADILDDDEVNTKDVLTLSQIVKSGSWEGQILPQEIELDARLELANPEQTITTGDEFEVNYVINSGDYEVNGIAGNISYDQDKLDLVSITKSTGFIGSNKDGKFIYINTSPSSKDTTEETEEEESKDVIVLKAKFQSLASGTATITLDDPEYFNGDTYYTIVEIDEETGESKPTTQKITLDIEAAKSADNSLSSLKIGDNEIELTDGVYEYSITVPNDVNTVDVEAFTSNIAASISSIISPEELAEGENTITITVKSEDGKEQTYTITVTREESSEEKTEETTSASSYAPAPHTSGSVKPQEKPVEEPDEPEPTEKGNNWSKIIIIGLTVAAILGLIYLIFKDEDKESKKANKDISKMKKENFDAKEGHNSKSNNKHNQNRNNKK